MGMTKDDIQRIRAKAALRGTEAAQPQKPIARTHKPPKAHQMTPGENGRLPNGSQFLVHWNGRVWSGHLTIFIEEVPGPNNSMTARQKGFVGEAKSVFGLLSKLDRMYRAWVKGGK